MRCSAIGAPRTRCPAGGFCRHRDAHAVRIERSCGCLGGTLRSQVRVGDLGGAVAVSGECLLGGPHRLFILGML